MLHVALVTTLVYLSLASQSTLSIYQEYSSRHSLIASQIVWTQIDLRKCVIAVLDSSGECFDFDHLWSDHNDMCKQLMAMKNDINCDYTSKCALWLGRGLRVLKLYRESLLCLL